MNRTLLIIEDDEDIQKYYEIVLSPLKLTLLRAFNGKEALRVIASGKRIDLILLDVVMPVLDGEQFIRQLHTRRVKIPVIPCTCDESSAERIVKGEARFPFIFIKSQGGKVLKGLVKKALGAIKTKGG